jgi:hypothetical protein
VADVTIGEAWGTLRVANGYSYDPYGALQAPIDYS